MKTANVRILKYADENTIDFAIYDEDCAKFNEVVRAMSTELNEDWSTCLSHVFCDVSEDGSTIYYGGSVYVRNENESNGFYSKAV